MKIRVRLPDGRIYGQTGKVDFVNNVIAQDTDTLTVRGVIPNPVLGSQMAGGVNLRELIADQFVTVAGRVTAAEGGRPSASPSSSSSESSERNRMRSLQGQAVAQRWWPEAVARFSPSVSDCRRSPQFRSCSGSSRYP